MKFDEHTDDWHGHLPKWYAYERNFPEQLKIGES